MSAAKLTLISHELCPFVQRVAIMFHEKGIAFERINIDLKNKPAWFLAISPAGKVPLLKISRPQEQEVVLFESIPICEYIEEVYPDPAMHPRDAITKAQHRAWIEFSTAMLADAWRLLNADDERIAASAATAFRQKLARFEESLAAGPYFYGDTFTIVDAVTAPVFRYFDILACGESDPLFAGLTRVSMWRNSMKKRPSVDSAVARDYAERFNKYLTEQNALLALR